ncbi:GNAT family N-acetyltransferase [Streptomyces sp. NPDC047085]|uniref:GNAT family N-acetyltransferase n=1 Tax=Streptomyces sp. NPDC047085 TaxID=3155140 RepID=UPI0033DAE761
MNDITALEPQLANCRDFWLGWGAQDRLDECLTYYRSGLPYSALNGVLRLQSSEHMGHWVKQATNRLAGVPWRWWVGPDSAPDVQDRLADYGAVKVGSVPIMAVRIAQHTEISPPPSLKIEAIDGTKALSEWVRTYSRSFGFAPQLLDDIVQCEAGRTDATNIVRVTGRLDKEAIGTACMLDAHGVAGIYVVTTAEAHRRQGIGAALTAAALKAGRERGARIGTLQASSLGIPVYQHMAFQTIAEYQLFEIPTS